MIDSTISLLKENCEAFQDFKCMQGVFVHEHRINRQCKSHAGILGEGHIQHLTYCHMSSGDGFRVIWTFQNLKWRIQLVLATPC